MPLKLPSPHAQAIEAVRDNAPMLLGERILRTNVTAEIGQPLPVHSLLLSAMTSAGRGAVAAAARFTAWHCILYVDGNPAGIGEVSAKPVGWAALHPAALARSVVKSIDFAERLPRVDASTFDLALLRVPDASIHSLWLRSPDASEDAFVTLIRAGSDEQPKELDEPQFLAMLQNL